MGTAAESLFATLFPGNCRFCDAPLLRITRVPVCDPCLDAIRSRPEEAVCSICGERLLRPADRLDLLSPEARCGGCRDVAPPFAAAVAYGDYGGGLRDLIHLLKYDGVRPAANLLGRMLAESCDGFRPRFEIPSLVVPVPLHAAKLRARGFNQSELIARAAARCTGKDSEVVDAMVRLRDTGSQTGLSRAQRQENLRGAFQVSQPGVVRGRDILLVDDVYTTGATVSECARLLRVAGVARVLVATVARVPLPAATAADASFSSSMARAVHA